MIPLNAREMNGGPSATQVIELVADSPPTINFEFPLWNGAATTPRKGFLVVVNCQLATMQFH